MTDLTLGDIVRDLVDALTSTDRDAPIAHSATRTYQAGIGPFPERAALSMAAAKLRTEKVGAYAALSPRDYPGSGQECDLVIPGAWAIEVKLARPFGDNGKPAEHWSENILHPYPGSVSALGDALKLLGSAFSERKAVLIYGFTHDPPQLELEAAIQGFEVLAEQVLGIALGPRQFEARTGLIHPYHQIVAVYGWELLGYVS